MTGFFLTVVCWLCLSFSLASPSFARCTRYRFTIFSRCLLGVLYRVWERMSASIDLVHSCLVVVVVFLGTFMCLQSVTSYETELAEGYDRTVAKNVHNETGWSFFALATQVACLLGSYKRGGKKTGHFARNDGYHSILNTTTFPTHNHCAIWDGGLFPHTTAPWSPFAVSLSTISWVRVWSFFFPFFFFLWSLW